MKYDYNKKFGLLKFHSGYGQFNLNSPKGYSLKIINAQTDSEQIPHDAALTSPRSVDICSQVNVGRSS